jgi:hypothetical protein
MALKNLPKLGFWFENILSGNPGAEVFFLSPVPKTSEIWPNSQTSAE